MFLQILILVLGPVLEPEGPVLHYKTEHCTLTCAAFSWDSVYFLPSSWYVALLWI